MNRAFENLGLLFLRVFVSGTMIVFHGWSALSKPGEFAKFLEMKGLFLPYVLTAHVLSYMAIAAETVFPFMIIIGLFTRFSALVASINMFVALFVYHIIINGDPINIWEKAFIYMGVFVFLTIAGGGNFTLDNVLAVRKRKGRHAKWRIR